MVSWGEMRRTGVFATIVRHREFRLFFLAAPESPIECECVRAHVSLAPSDVVRLGKREVGGRGGRSALPSQPNKLSPYPEPRERERLDVRS